MKKGVTFGIGIGILLACVVLFGAYAIQRSIHLTQIDALNAEIANLELALELTNNENESENNFNFIFPNTDNYDIIEEVDEYEDYTQEYSIEEQYTQDLTYEPEQENEPEPEELYVSVVIPFNLNATDIGELLYDYGVIQSVSDFVTFIIQNDFNLRVMAGTFDLPINASFEELERRIITDQ